MSRAGESLIGSSCRSRNFLKNFIQVRLVFFCERPSPQKHRTIAPKAVFTPGDLISTAPFAVFYAGIPAESSNYLFSHLLVDDYWILCKYALLLKRGVAGSNNLSS